MHIWKISRVRCWYRLVDGKFVEIPPEERKYEFKRHLIQIGIKFRYEGQPKKTLNENQQRKRDGRAHKKTRRDKSKTHKSWSNRGAGKEWKRFCNKKHRQWEKRNIERGEWYNCGNRTHKNKRIFDPWIWD